VWAILVVVYLGCAVLGHIVLGRLPLPLNFVVRFLVPGAICGLALAAQLYLTDGIATTTVAALLAYALLSELYIFIFTMISSSISANLLLALRAGPRTLRSIDEEYNDEYMVTSRIAKLQASGMLLPAGDGYVVGPPGKRLLATFGRLQRFFGFRRAADAGPAASGLDGVTALDGRASSDGGA